MSLSKPRTNASPVQRRFELKLAVGAASYYDTEAKNNVTITGPAGAWADGTTYPADPEFKFIVLDTLSFVGGYNDSTESGIWSNEIRSTRDEKLTVRTRKGILVEGYYADIKDQIKSDGGKFGNSVYIAYQDGGEWKLGNLKLIGAGVSAWFDFKEGKYFDSDPGVSITGWVGKKKGSNKYFEPIFASWTVPAADLSAASDLDETLQAYFSSSGADRTGDEPLVTNGFGEQVPMIDEPPF